MKKERFLTLGLIIISLVLISFSGCDKEREIEIIIKAPTVELVSINDISETGAIITARIANNGGSKISEKGIVLDGSKNIVSTSTNSETTFTITVSNLEAGRSYSVKAYAKNSQKTGYSSSLEFKTIKKDEEPEPDPEPILKIESATEVGHYSAILNAKIDDIVKVDDYAVSFEYSQDESFAKSIKAEQVSNAQNSLSLSAKIEDLSRTTNYKYRLKAEKNSGEILYSDTTEFSTSGDNFSVEGAYFDNVASDSEGNIYATALFEDEYKNAAAMVVKFSPKGNLLWRQDVITKNSEQTFGIAVYNNVVYAQIAKGNMGELGDFGSLSLYAYDSASGDILWTTVLQANDGVGSEVVISEDNFIYSNEGSQINKLDLSGNIVASVKLKGAKGFGAISFIDNKILASGGSFHSGEHHSMIWAMDKDLNILWSQAGTKQDIVSASYSIVSFPEKNLVFISEAHKANITQYGKSYILCYEYSGDSLTLKWMKYVDGSEEMKFIREADNFYVYNARLLGGLDIDGPLLYNTSGDIVWKSSVPQSGNLAIFGNKLYMAQDNGKLLIINK